MRYIECYSRQNVLLFHKKQSISSKNSNPWQPNTATNDYSEESLVTGLGYHGYTNVKDTVAVVTILICMTSQYMEGHRILFLVICNI